MRPLRALADLFLPRHCAVCGTTLLGGENCLCTNCIMQMPLTFFWEMERNPMAERLNAAVQRIRDSRVITGPEPYSYAAALYFYKENYRLLSKALKYEANLTVGKYVSDALGRKLSSSPLFSDVDMIVPVPLHWTRRLSRGYNQAEVIAMAVSRRMGCRVDLSVLRRVRRTRSQANLEIGAKAANVQGAFKASFPSSEPPRHILLVDDVCTTGSTLAQCHTAMRDALVASYGRQKAVAVRISAATLAFVGD